MLAEQVGNVTLRRRSGTFGFGRTTGIGFPGEASGTCRRRRTGGTRSIRATVSFGQGIAVTPLQMASVYATIANGGELGASRGSSRGSMGADGTRSDAPARRRGAIVRPDTADLLTSMLACVVEDGTG